MVNAKAISTLAQKMGEIYAEFSNRIHKLEISPILGMPRAERDQVTGETLQTFALHPQEKLYNRRVVKQCNANGHEIVTWITPDGKVAARPLCKRCGLTREEIRSAPC
jgi:hypothetical protein